MSVDTPCPSMETVRGGLLSQDFFQTAASKRKEKLAVNNKIWEGEQRSPQLTLQVLEQP